MITFSQAVTTAREFAERVPRMAEDVGRLVQEVSTEVSIESTDYFCDKMEQLPMVVEPAQILIMEHVLRYFWVKFPNGKTIGSAGPAANGDVGRGSSAV